MTHFIQIFYARGNTDTIVIVPLSLSDSGSSFCHNFSDVASFHFLHSAVLPHNLFQKSFSKVTGFLSSVNLFVCDVSDSISKAKSSHLILLLIFHQDSHMHCCPNNPINQFLYSVLDLNPSSCMPRHVLHPTFCSFFMLQLYANSV